MGKVKTAKRDRFLKHIEKTRNKKLIQREIQPTAKAALTSLPLPEFVPPVV